MIGYWLMIGQYLKVSRSKWLNGRFSRAVLFDQPLLSKVTDEGSHSSLLVLKWTYYTLLQLFILFWDSTRVSLYGSQFILGFPLCSCMPPQQSCCLHPCLSRLIYHNMTCITKSSEQFPVKKMLCSISFTKEYRRLIGALAHDATTT